MGNFPPTTPPPSLAEGPVGRRFGGQGLRQGFLPVPTALRRYAATLGLTPELEQTVVALLDCGHGRGLVRVRMAELAGRLGVRERTAQRRLARLIALGYLRRIHRTDETGADLANAYDLRPLWQRLDEGDHETGGRVTVVSPPISRDLRDLDPRKDPPTPIVNTIETRDGERGTPTTGASERTTEPSPLPAPRAGEADRAAMASFLEPILDTYQEAYPAAAVGQFLGLRCRYGLDSRTFGEALRRAKQRVDERIADASELGPVTRPVAYLYAALAKDLAAAPPASSPVESVPPDAEVQLRAAALRLAVAVGAPQPASAASRILRLFRRSGLSPAAFWTRMRQAAGELRQCAINVRDQDGEPNGVPLLLAILRRVLAGRKRPGGKMAGVSRERGTSDQRVAAEPPAISEVHPVWRAVLEYLRGVLTRENFTRCLAARVAGQEGGVLRLVVASPFEQVWCTRQLGRHVQGALAACGQADLRVVFVVAPTEGMATLLMGQTSPG
jgi:hypothetical protein